jgi:hypothetical protein
MSFPNIDKNLKSAKKFVEIAADIDKQDKKLEKKFNNNARELKFYKDLLEDTNKHYFTIIKNLKDNV